MDRGGAGLLIEMHIVGVIELRLDTGTLLARFLAVVPALAPIANHVVIASQREAIDRIGQIASAATTISFDKLGRYMMSGPRSRSSTDHASSSHGEASDSDDQYITIGIPSPNEVAAIVGGSRHVQMSQYLAEDLLHSYRFISSRLGIPLVVVREEILRDRQATAASTHTPRQSQHVRRRDSFDAVSGQGSIGRPNSDQDSPSDGRSVRGRHDAC
ncbi:uncharacterized protein LOC131039814 [Cryptomeria japonica]|uniref:uncharacterized protein LOC131039814 n=1 Tax=Cryptomeria japonica TaxID=3369 RepID=UPI0027DA0221|nr:uncharacterized protein LOC131039814 [Cryptomeria japonica]XP_057828644.2 uncharacterized protein LOC131039814 [Cryptomeria japonica]